MRVFIILLLRLWLVGFSRVNSITVTITASVRTGVRFSFGVRVGIRLPNLEGVKLYVGFPMCRHSSFYMFNYRTCQWRVFC